MANTGPAAAGRPPGAVSSADGRDPRARGARPRTSGSGWHRRGLTPAPRESLSSDRVADSVSRTRFAPAPTGLSPPGPRRERDLGLGHGAIGGAPVLLRIEDHDRVAAGRSTTRPCSRTWPGSGSRPTRARSASQTTPRRTRRRSSACRARSRSTAATVRGRPSSEWADDHGRPWHGPGCPGGCRERGLDGPIAARRTRRRVRALDGPPGRTVRGRRGGAAATCRFVTATATGRTASPSSSTTCARSVDLVVRGRDLLAATAGPDPARTSARARDAGDLRPSPRSSDDPTARSCRRPTATPRSATCGPPADAGGAHRRGGGGGRADRRSPADRGGRRCQPLSRYIYYS